MSSPAEDYAPKIIEQSERRELARLLAKYATKRADWIANVGRQLEEGGTRTTFCPSEPDKCGGCEMYPEWEEMLGEAYDQLVTK